APTNTSPPTIAGTEQQGRLLTARNGAWANGPSTFFYRWQRCSLDGSDCTNIDNAASKTYRLASDDVDHTVRVMVTASNPDGQASASSKTTDVISANTPPRNTAAPTVTGKLEPGE